jgi:hypothetical protein
MEQPLHATYDVANFRKIAMTTESLRTDSSRKTSAGNTSSTIQNIKTIGNIGATFRNQRWWRLANKESITNLFPEAAV